LHLAEVLLARQSGEMPEKDQQQMLMNIEALRERYGLSGEIEK
jgi:hypothetical protein